MFFGSIENDIKINIFLLTAAFLFAVFAWRKKKSFILGIFTFSALSNLILYTDRFSPFFVFYDLKWIVKFTLWYWPWINVAFLALLIANHVKRKSDEVNKTSARLVCF